MTLMCSTQLCESFQISLDGSVLKSYGFDLPFHFLYTNPIDSGEYQFVLESIDMYNFESI
jgi:hypothetical protein